MGWNNTPLFDRVTKLIHDFVYHEADRVMAYREVVEMFADADFDTFDEARLWDPQLERVLIDEGYIE